MTQIGTLYAQALYGLAQEENTAAATMQELNALEESFSQEPGFLRLLSSPNLSKQERCRILDDSFRGKISRNVLNFLKLLTEKGYARHFPDCCRAFENYYNEDHGILPVTAVTAVPLTQEQSERLADKLSALTGKAIQLHNRVDASCLGGVRLDYDGRQVDDTVSHRLENIRNLLKNTVL
ncbi:MAG TPA: ATP synthase F1 subunit delta [Candidatus Faecousia intestinigallinarum]|nr:ATP synthase F1 subunit delta [Candidatus Faecousia intestinigallinarum]